MKRPLTPDAAYARLSALCARSEQCAADLQRRCRAWGLDAAQTEAVIERLRRERYVDDERYCHAFVHDKALIDGWGPDKIVYALAAKGLPRVEVENALATIDPDVFARNLDAALKAKRHTLPPALAVEVRYRRLMAFATGRGFRAAEVAARLKACGNETAANKDEAEDTP